ncbi:cupin domain-containing protein [Sorangium sp. So ce1036]|uniref:JmjC domain-containing protein n=1 Tax=Sorangium sp. So ce1036 TaxID=3133328 RepID=UPI003F017492
METSRTDTWSERLGDWVAGLGGNEEGLPRTHLHRRFSAEAFRSLPGFAEAADLERFIARYPAPIMAVGGPCWDETAGLRDRFLIRPEQALKYYAAGATLELDHADLFSPELARVVGTLAGILRLPAGVTGKAIVYASPSSGGFPAHFDAYYNFVFHMGGVKRWSLWNNDNATDPVVHYEVETYPFVPPNLAPYWQGTPTPTREPPMVEELSAGSLLFLPRGIWHETAASGYSLSINITYSIPTVADLVSAAIARALLSHPHFRSTPLRLDRPAASLAEAARVLGALPPEVLAEAQGEGQDLYQIFLRGYITNFREHLAGVMDEAKRK